MPLDNLTISYPDFVLGTIINPEEVDQNNNEITTKINELVDGVNEQEIIVLDLIDSKANTTHVNNLHYIQTVNLVTHEASGAHDSRYYTKSELTPFLTGGDTIIKEEVFTIVNADNGDGTFTYNDGTINIVGQLQSGGQVFTLTKGTYELGKNRIEATINDTLRRSLASGGLTEIDASTILLTSAEGAGAEITFKYYERLGLSYDYSVSFRPDVPPFNNGHTMWFEELV